MSFLELAERCEAATEPDRELDCLVLEHAYRERYGRDVQWIDDGVNLRTRRMWVAGGPWEDVPRYTSSVDAALTLVPEGWRMCRYHSPASECHVVTLITDTLPAVAGGQAYTIALAICAAALRARAAHG